MSPDQYFLYDQNDVFEMFNKFNINFIKTGLVKENGQNCLRNFENEGMALAVKLEIPIL